MYFRYTGTPDSDRFLTYVRTEGDRVYFLPDSESTEWMLLYDFGLDVDGECEVAIPSFRWSDDYTPHIAPVRCIDKGDAADFDNLPSITLADASIELGKASYEGTWLLGIGSVAGVEYGTYFCMDGIGGELWKVTLADETVVYHNKTLGIADVAACDGCPEVTVSGRTITVKADEPARIYGIDGRSLGAAPAGTFSVASAGCYIVATRTGATKVMVR